MTNVTADKVVIPVWEKYALTIPEACEYFNLGEKKTRQLMSDYEDYGFTLQIGNRTTIKRKKFEEFLDKTGSV